MRKHAIDVAHAWWRKLLAMLSPPRPNLEERLARQYTAEIRLARLLAQDAESLTRYPHQSVCVLDASEHAARRAQRIQRAFKELPHLATEPVTMRRRTGRTVWGQLHANISELSEMSEAYLADAYAVERNQPETAGLLLQLHQEATVDRRDLVWTLAQLEPTGVEASRAERVA